MKTATIIPVLALILTMGCQSEQSAALSFTLKNNSALSRKAAPVAISLEELGKKGMPTEADQKWAPFDQNGKPIPFQYDDLDQDGTLDELFFLVDIEANGSSRISLKPAEKTDFPAQTHIRLGEKTGEGITPRKEAKRLETVDNTITSARFQYEGVGWENEEVAFRNYLDLRNGIDIFGKTKEGLFLDKAGLEGNETYHELLDWGMDILKVGASLGAGGVAFWYKDSLVRLSSPESGFKFQFEGPVRAQLLLDFKDVDLGDKKIDVKHTISIQAGTYAFDAKLEFSDAEDISPVVGLVDLHNLPGQDLSAGNNIALYTYGLQSENQDSLGMAVMAAENLVQKIVDTDSISEQIPNTYAFVLKGNSLNYRFYSGWELSAKDFASEKAFEAYLKKEAELWKNELVLEWEE